jgi:hypothetical protein
MVEVQTIYRAANPYSFQASKRQRRKLIGVDAVDTNATIIGRCAQLVVLSVDHDRVDVVVVYTLRFYTAPLSLVVYT